MIHKLDFEQVTSTVYHSDTYYCC